MYSITLLSVSKYCLKNDKFEGCSHAREDNFYNVDELK